MNSTWSFPFTTALRHNSPLLSVFCYLPGLELLP